MAALAPRSTSSHCGSLNALDQRVLVFPSTAAEAGNEEFSTEEAVAVLPWESRVALAAASLALSEPGCAPRDETPANTATRASAATRADSHRYRDLRPVGWCGISLITVLSEPESSSDPERSGPPALPVRPGVSRRPSRPSAGPAPNTFRLEKRLNFFPQLNGRVTPRQGSLALILVNIRRFLAALAPMSHNRQALPAVTGEEHWAGEAWARSAAGVGRPEWAGFMRVRPAEPAAVRHRCTRQERAGNEK